MQTLREVGIVRKLQIGDIVMITTDATGEFLHYVGEVACVEDARIFVAFGKASNTIPLQGNAKIWGAWFSRNELRNLRRTGMS